MADNYLELMKHCVAAAGVETWVMREDVEQLGRFAPTVAFDVSLRVSNIQAYVDDVKSRINKTHPDAHTFVFGHMDDGNLHIVVRPRRPEPNARREIEACVYEPLAAINGSVSVEHGILNPGKTFDPAA